MLYVFGRRPLDGDDCASQFVELLSSTSPGQADEKRTVLLRSDVAYAYCMGMYSYFLVNMADRLLRCPT